MQTRNSWILVVLLTALVANASEAKKTWYIQAKKTWARTQPNMKSKKVVQLHRGQTVTELAQKGKWLKVQYKKRTVWLSRFFLSRFKPVGKAKLLKDMKDSEEKASRRRPDSYVTAGSARGNQEGEDEFDLTRRGIASARHRMGREKFRSDYEALQKMEKTQSDLKLDHFVREANLAK